MVADHWYPIACVVVICVWCTKWVYCVYWCWMHEMAHTTNHAYNECMSVWCGVMLCALICSAIALCMYVLVWCGVCGVLWLLMNNSAICNMFCGWIEKYKLCVLYDVDIKKKHMVMCAHCVQLHYVWFCKTTSWHVDYTEWMCGVVIVLWWCVCVLCSV